MSFSQANQDEFVLAVLDGKRRGVFLEIGAYHPTLLSNTYLLERDYGWTGLAIDITPQTAKQFAEARRCEFLLADATQLDYKAVLAGMPEQIDYLSLDIDPGPQTLACLRRLPLELHRFTVITYEHDAYSGVLGPREESRAILKDAGYELVAGNIAHNGCPFEDWWLDGTLVPDATIERFRRESDEPIESGDYMKGL